jgi:hypothetical protein
MPALTDSVAETEKKVVVDTEVGSVEGNKVASAETLVNLEGMRSPRKAALLSTALPGLGQAYNHKYWKIPIIYAGFGVAVWYLQDNLSNIRLYKDAFIALNDDDPTTVNTTGFSPQQLEQLIDTYTQWRDLSIIAMAAIYILNIVDASVDAHLFYFDVSEDISMNIKPFWTPLAPTSPGLTLTMKL